MEELLEITSTGQFEDNGRLTIRSALWKDDDLEIGFLVDHGDDTSSEWVVFCHDVLEYFLAEPMGMTGMNVWSGDHPVLSQYLRRHEALYFPSAPANADEVVGQLWSEHLRVTEDWIPFDRYVNRSLPLRRLLERGSGLLAEVPDLLIDAFEVVLARHECAPSLLVSLSGARVAAAQMIHFGES
jgi:hypothetical protein